MMVTNHSNKSPFRSAVIASSVALFAVLLIFIAIIYAQGVFASKEIVSATVTYDADPYNEGQSDPHTYTITDAEDIAFLTETLKEIKRLPSGGIAGIDKSSFMSSMMTVAEQTIILQGTVARRSL